MEFVRYQLKGDDLNGACNRWIQPPQAAYFVTTVDRNGNTNVTPVTMGTCIGNQFFSFTLSNLRVKEWDLDKYPYQEGIKQGYCNLREVPECVISYFGHNLLRESWISSMPIPKGISELDVMGLTPLPSVSVRPCGIAECPVNLEARVLYVHKLGEKWTNYICEVVNVTVHKDLDEQNKTGPYKGYGVMPMDLLFEVFIGKGNTEATKDFERLYYARLDFDKIERCPEDIGCAWKSTFREWILTEQSRGKLTQAETDRIFDLNHAWAANRDPVSNAAIKEELTSLLKKAVVL